MPGPKAEYPIELFDNEINELRCLVKSHKASQAKVRRARIILTAHEHPDWTNQQIAHAVGTSDRMVRKWRRRWVETRSLDDLPRRRFSP